MPPHEGSHPITETTCDGPTCWCRFHAALEERIRRAERTMHLVEESPGEIHVRANVDGQWKNTRFDELPAREALAYAFKWIRGDLRI